MFIFIDGHKYTTTGAGQKMALVDGEAWVTLTGRNVGIYHIFGQQNHEEVLIDLSDYFDNDPYYICKGNNSVFVFEQDDTPIDYDEEFIKSFVEISTLTREVIQHKIMPRTAHCYPIVARHKLWFTTEASLDTSSTSRHYLFYYDLLNDTFSSNVEIPVNKQYRPMKMVWGRSDYLYVAAFNDSSVVKFSAITGAHLNTIFTNRRPSHMVTNSDRQVLVAGYNGIVSTVDQVADTYSNDIGLTTACTSFADDGTNLWAVNPALERVTKATTGVPATHDVIEMNGDTLDFSIAAFSETSFNDIIVVPPYTHNEWVNDTITEVTEDLHIVLLTDTSLFYATNLTDSWDMEEVRVYTFDVRGTAMISTGPQDYYGETT